MNDNRDYTIGGLTERGVNLIIDEMYSGFSMNIISALEYDDEDLPNIARFIDKYIELPGYTKKGQDMTHNSKFRLKLIDMIQKHLGWGIHEETLIDTDENNPCRYYGDTFNDGFIKDIIVFTPHPVLHFDEENIMTLIDHVLAPIFMNMGIDLKKELGLDEFVMKLLF